MKYNTGFILRISLVSALGGLLFGYDWVVIGGAKPFYEKFFDIVDSPNLQGWAMSSALLGCIFGALISGILSEKYGRKKTLILSALLFSLSAIGTGFAEALSTFIMFRLLGGIGIGLASTQSPIYIAEVSPGSMRGKFVSLNQLTIVIGILLAQIMNYLIADEVNPDASILEIINSWNGQWGWRWMFWAETIPAVLFLVLTFTIPESPRWLARIGMWERSDRTLRRIGGADFAISSHQDIELSIKDSGRKINIKILLNKRIFPILMLGITLAVFQQWCGINVVFNYAEEVFSAAGYGITDILFNIVLTGTVNLIFTFIAIFTVDIWGRKKLLLLGAFGLALSYLILGIFYFSDMQGIFVVMVIIIAIAIYAMTLAPVTWVILSEIFPNKVRGSAMAVATTSLWIACFILTYTFPLLNEVLNAFGTFWLYAFICVIGFIFIKTKLVETKGRTLEEVEKMLTQKPK
jgi:SP family sugar porter-like MFS transporter